MAPLESPDTLPEEQSRRIASPQQFGPYVLLKRLGRGGMGDVSLAKQVGVAGIEKLCVVKRIRSRFTEDREYVARFIDEARTVVVLMHRNVCQVFDVGAVDGQYYLAMELVPGRDVRHIAERAREFAIAIPPAITLHIVGEMLEALDYAHRLTDPASDASLGIVHRDVSPQNVIVSFEGEVKLIDFGLAASTLKLEQTEPGVILGKLQYMAPEQAKKEQVDRRTDVFASGIFLYELLSGERWYEGFSMDAILDAVRAGGHRPAGLAKIAPSLRALIERATAASPRDRFASAAQFRQALRDVQIEERLLSSTADAREFMATLFPGEEADDRKERAKLAAQALRIGDVDSGKSVRFAAAPGPSSSSSAAALAVLANATTLPPPASASAAAAMKASAVSAKRTTSGSFPVAGGTDRVRKLKSSSDEKPEVPTEPNARPSSDEIDRALAAARGDDVNVRPKSPFDTEDATIPSPPSPRPDIVDQEGATLANPPAPSSSSSNLFDEPEDEPTIRVPRMRGPTAQSAQDVPTTPLPPRGPDGLPLKPRSNLPLAIVVVVVVAALIGVLIKLVFF